MFVDSIGQKIAEDQRVLVFEEDGYGVIVGRRAVVADIEGEDIRIVFEQGQASKRGTWRKNTRNVVVMDGLIKHSPELFI